MLPSGLLGVVCILVQPVGPDGPGTPRKEWKRLSGRWTILSIESDGQKVRWKGMNLVFKGEELIWEDRSEAKNKDRITYKIRPGSRPKQIDVTFVRSPGTVVDGRTLLGIYAITGDTLRICWSHEEGKRPTKFTGKKEPTLFIMKRASR